MEGGGLITADHHQQQQLCENRPRYRQGRKLTSVKTYTISSESQHLFIYGVPKINLRSELKKQCSNYGNILKISPMENYETEIFTECFHVHYQRIQSARIAKRFLDNKSFYGGVLHVCYAPEFEPVEETRQKLLQRTKDVLHRLNTNVQYSNKPLNDTTVYKQPLHVPKDKEIYSLDSSNTSNIILNQQSSLRMQTSLSMHESPNSVNQSSGYLPITQTPLKEIEKRIEVTAELPNSEEKIEDLKNASKLESRCKQTPAYFWKDANTESISSFKGKNKRISIFIPNQITKKKKLK